MTILLAVDSSLASDTAAREAASRPWPNGTTVKVVSVTEPATEWTFPELDNAIEQAAQDAVLSAACYFREAGVPASTAVVHGDPPTGIVDQAAESGADWIVIGSHKATGVTQFLLGSVARGVARLAVCSVEIVRPRPGAGPLKILVATDGSECSMAAVRSVAQRPWPSETKFRILSVVEPSAPLLPVPYFSPHKMEELRGKDMQRSQQAVSSAESILSKAGIEATSTVAVPAATPKELILSEAAEWGAGLIVVGSHGRQGVSRLLLGSVSEAVALHANCSVEIVRLPRSEEKSAPEN